MLNLEAVFVESLPSPWGSIVFSWGEDGTLLGIRLPGTGHRPRPRGQRPTGAPTIRRVEAWLQAWWNPFPGSWQMPGNTPFARKVYACVHQIPAGATRSYGEVAAACGSVGASRAVGNCMARNPMPLIVPCHRVLAASCMGGFGGGLSMKADLLAGEVGGSSAHFGSNQPEAKT